MKKNRKIKEKILLFLVLIHSSLFASTPITWANVKKMALKNDFSGEKLANISFSESLLDVKISKSSLYPSIFLFAGARRFLQEDSTFGLRMFVGPRVQWTLYQGGKRKSDFKISQINSKQSFLLIEDEENKLISDMRKDFADVIFEKKHVNHLKNVLKQTKLDMNYVSLKFRSGLEYKVIYDSMVNSVLNSEFKLRLSQEKLQMAKKKIAYYLNTDANQNLIISSENFVIDESKIQTNFEDKIENSFALKKILNSQSRAEYAVKNSKSLRKPVVNFRTDFILVETDDRPIFPFLSLGVNLGMPLFEANKNKNIIKKAKLVEEKTKLNYEKTRRKLKEQFELKWQKYESKKKIIAMHKKFMNVLKQKMNLDSLGYRNGTVAFSIWNKSIKNFHNKKIKMLELERDLQHIYADMLYLLGEN